MDSCALLLHLQLCFAAFFPPHQSFCGNVMVSSEARNLLFKAREGSCCLGVGKYF